jgi:hypothetical protein
MGILLDAKLIPLYRDSPSRADAPVARFAGFAPLSLTLRVVGDLTETVFASQPQLFAVELAESGEVHVVGDLELAGLEQEEGGDQIWFAADDAELAAELLLPVGHGAGTPFPPPVREAAVETVSNHEDMSCPEHQIRLSKRVIAKFVQPLELLGAHWRAEFRRQNEKPP